MRPPDRFLAAADGFSYVYTAQTARDVPFPSQDFGEDYTFVLNAASVGKRVLQYSDAPPNASCIHVSHGLNTSIVRGARMLDGGESLDSHFGGAVGAVGGCSKLLSAAVEYTKTLHEQANRVGMKLTPRATDRLGTALPPSSGHSSCAPSCTSQVDRTGRAAASSAAVVVGVSAGDGEATPSVRKAPPLREEPMRRRVAVPAAPEPPEKKMQSEKESSMESSKEGEEDNGEEEGEEEGEEDGEDEVEEGESEGESEEWVDDEDEGEQASDEEDPAARPSSSIFASDPADADLELSPELLAADAMLADLQRKLSTQADEAAAARPPRRPFESTEHLWWWTEEEEALTVEAVKSRAAIREAAEAAAAAEIDAQSERAFAASASRAAIASEASAKARVEAERARLVATLMDSGEPPPSATKPRAAAGDDRPADEAPSASPAAATSSQGEGELPRLS